MIKNLFKGCWTIPNLLSVIRIILVPIFAVLFYNGHPYWALFTLFLSGVSDFLDGKIARKYNQISELGKLLDPVADKLTQITIAIMLFLEFQRCDSEGMRAFSWVFLFFLAKEALMILVGAIMLAVGIKPSAAEIWGKVATFAFYGIMLIVIAFAPEMGALRAFFTLPELAIEILVIISAVLTLIALLSYIPGTLKQFKERSKNK